ncbi:ABC-F family ATP-binding cassette domain-containing protein [Terrabacter sp. MAHUQ-38]|uniref:ABC-F family ATP-binding cassette domain-containing protein n=1 Tax=unclassified Terrabacter TaxID=2630222 RepID=UPI00165EBA02|nr:ABC-F family ATP-binding cassette domain-containing protein [Terrabacter sp. MAHUQ-38]MBC9819936.1 ABC-F family ATP-binding cassette domain-containing protein [Terrabacter sp. MAHUQ-38]
MSSTLTITDLAVAFGARTLFAGLDLTLSDGDVTAVVGPNGSGKSTLMRTIVGELPVDAGTIRLAPRDATVAWLPQVLPDPEETLLAYARRRTGVVAADVELECASAAIASGEPHSDERYATALERWLALGAADLDERLPEVAAHVGLDVDGTRPLGTLSGGQAARACLVAVLLSQYDVLLLDEPTNNLDGRGLDLMADFVRGHDGPVLIASHDRTFLDAVTTNVVELDVRQQRIAHYTGGWSDYVAQRELARSQAWDAYEGYAAERDSLLAQSRQRHDWADKGRRNVATGGEPDKHIREKHRARADRQAAKGARLERAAGRLDAVDQPRKEWQLRYTITEGRPSADVVATLADAVVERHGFRLGPVALLIGRGDRVAIVGDNGSGKTTLLAALLGDLPLASGRQSLGTRVSVGVIDQGRHLLDDDARVLEVVHRELGHDPRTGQEWRIADVRTLLAKFGLGAEHVARPARSLSMGERTRALMALFQGREVNVLVLDEPTNHLDVDAIEQLEAALAAFGGTVLVVSHDEQLLGGIRLTHRWHVADGRVDVEVL